MIPGEIVYGDGDITLNEGAERLELDVVNTGDRPVQVAATCTCRRPTRRWSSTARRPTVTDSTSPPGPRCVSNPVSASMFRSFR